ncbi:hypothetical protein FHG66_09110 [Rubellimicrobium rubrum]|uniref:Uncharacterized protein n=1 Tax=Rubellimicrobium rubrum TaxID=2585369 RepID=A0A5C4MZ13_9RHOB|nr:hypothetical protein [Rubellimicrobium rubrum]TNC50110.1 hypothetical protein FHG66_09110 [Rubellimicrobium rubrum]
MVISRVVGSLIALHCVVLGAVAQADVVFHPDTALEFPTGSTFPDVPEARPLMKKVVEILNSHGYSLARMDLGSGIVGGKRLIDANTTEMLIFRFTRDVEDESNVLVEWLYGQYVLAFGYSEPRRVVVKQNSETMEAVIKEVQLYVLFQE